jgi:CRP-like cAMP-binding protein
MDDMVTETMTPAPEKAASPELLRLSPYFAGFDDVILEEIARMMKPRPAARHEILWLEQEPARTVYFVASGLVKLFKTSPGGKEQILKLAYPGDCFGHAGVFNGGHHPESAQALVDSTLYGITKSSLGVLLSEHRQLAFNVIKALATEMHHYMTLVEDLSLRCVRGRLARMLLAQDSGGAFDMSPVLTRADMAAMTGTVREVIGKSLKSLEDSGAISYDRRSIVIRDREALRAIMSSA